MIGKTFTLIASLALLVAGCAEQAAFKPSEFAQQFDPGKIFESVFRVLREGEETAMPNTSSGTEATCAKQSYFRVFFFEPTGATNDLAGLVARLKDSAETSLRAEGFEMEHRDHLPSDLSISYHSDNRSGTVHIFTTRTPENRMRVIGIIYERPRRA